MTEPSEPDQSMKIKRTRWLLCTMQATWSIKCIYLPLLQAGIEVMHLLLIGVHEQSCVGRESVAPCEMWSCLLSAYLPSNPTQTLGQILHLTSAPLH